MKKGETFEPRVVLTGASNFDYTEIVSGLKEGEQVAMLAAAALQAQRQQNNDRMRQQTRRARHAAGRRPVARVVAVARVLAAVAAVVAAPAAAVADPDPRPFRETSMLIGEIIRVALGALRANKLRSLLTMLGIVIGVAAVIAVVALGTGAQTAVKDRISSLGTTLLTVMPGQQRGMGVTFDQSMKLTMDDAKALEDQNARRRSPPCSPR